MSSISHTAPDSTVVFLNILGREAQSLGGKAKAGSVQSLTPSSKTCVSRSGMWIQRSILPRMQAAVHSGTKLRSLRPQLQPSPRHRICSMGCFAYRAILLRSGISVLDDEGKENPAFLQAFISLHDQSKQP